jgi:GAF domain-containing protein
MAGKDEGRRGLAALFRRGDAETGGDSEVARLLEINRALLTELDPRRLYSKILDAAVELTGAERAFLLVARAGAEADVAASRNVDREEVKHAAAKVSRTVVNKVLATGASQIIESALEDPSLAPSSSISEMRLVSILALPLHARGAVVGCLYLDNRFQKGKFTEAHRELMERFADQAALAFENARLHAANEAARHELEQLNSKLKQQVELKESELQSIRNVLEKKQEHVVLKHDYP